MLFETGGIARFIRAFGAPDGGDAPLPLPGRSDAAVGAPVGIYFAIRDDYRKFKDSDQ